MADAPPPPEMKEVPPAEEGETCKSEELGRPTRKKPVSFSQRDCANCGAEEGSIPGKLMHLNCSKCKLVSYCSASCQRQHWVSHQKFCLSPEQRSVRKQQDDREKSESVSKKEIPPEVELCMKIYKEILIEDKIYAAFNDAFSSVPNLSKEAYEAFSKDQSGLVGEAQIIECTFMIAKRDNIMSRLESSLLKKFRKVLKGLPTSELSRTVAQSSAQYATIYIRAIADEYLRFRIKKIPEFQKSIEDHGGIGWEVFREGHKSSFNFKFPHLDGQMMSAVLESMKREGYDRRSPKGLEGVRKIFLDAGYDKTLKEIHEWYLDFDAASERRMERRRTRRIESKGTPKPRPPPRTAPTSVVEVEEEEEEEEEEENGEWDACSDSDCAICLEPLSAGEATQRLKCGHRFHRKCIRELRDYGVSQLCPLCRAKLPASPQDRYDEWFPRFLRIHREVEKEAAKRDKNFSPPRNKLGFKLMHEVWKELPEETLEKLKTIRQHIEAAAVQGCGAAAFTCGLHYRDGEGCPVDIWRAKDFWEMGAELGSEKCSLNLGILLSDWNFDGGGGDDDDDDGSDASSDSYGSDISDSDYSDDESDDDFEAEMAQLSPRLQHLLRATQGADWDTSSQAMCNLGVAYFYGEDVKQNYRKAFKWYKKSADLGQPNGKNNLAVMYKNGYGGAELNPEKAVRLWQAVVKDGDRLGDFDAVIGAKVHLAKCYWQGSGVKKSLAKALALLREVHANGQGDHLRHANALLKTINQERARDNRKRAEEAAAPTVTPEATAAADEAMAALLAEEDEGQAGKTKKNKKKKGGGLKNGGPDGKSGGGGGDGGGEGSQSGQGGDEGGGDGRHQGGGQVAGGGGKKKNKKKNKKKK